MPATPVDGEQSVTVGLPDRIRMKILDTGSCWEWQGYRHSGYGQVWWEGRTSQAHRVVYELLVGPIPEGLTLDHLCRNPPCCNPEHLDPVTGRVNILRGQGPPAVNARRTYCVNGHPLEGANLRIAGRRSERRCRSCERDKKREWARKQRRDRGRPWDEPASETERGKSDRGVSDTDTLGRDQGRLQLSQEEPT